VRDLLLTEVEIENTIWEEIPHTNGARIRLYGFQRDKAVCQAQILKLQQEGWGALKEAQAENAKLKREIDSLIHDSD